MKDFVERMIPVEWYILFKKKKFEKSLIDLIVENLNTLNNVFDYKYDNINKLVTLKKDNKSDGISKLVPSYYHFLDPFTRIIPEQVKVIMFMDQPLLNVSASGIPYHTVYGDNIMSDNYTNLETVIRNYGKRDVYKTATTALTGSFFDYWYNQGVLILYYTPFDEIPLIKRDNKEIIDDSQLNHNYHKNLWSEYSTMLVSSLTENFKYAIFLCFSDLAYDAVNKHKKSSNVLIYGGGNLPNMNDREYENIISLNPLAETNKYLSDNDKIIW
jgi:hypothetical protein